MLIAVKEVNSKHSQIPRSLMNFQGKFSFSRSFKCLRNDISNFRTFQGVQGPAGALKYSDANKFCQLKTKLKILHNLGLHFFKQMATLVLLPSFAFFCLLFFCKMFLLLFRDALSDLLPSFPIK